MIAPLRPRISLLLCLLLALAGVVAPSAGAATRSSGCSQRVLILSAMPLELNPFIERATLADPEVRGGRTFHPGRLDGLDVVLGMSGIGPANATAMAEEGLTLPGCRFRAVLFSGVAGSTGDIGDVVVPSRWTLNEGRSWRPVDAAMLHVARSLDASRLGLSQDVPVGDAACACPGVDAATPVHLPTKVRLRVGGRGATTDPFNGRAVPCLPGGGDIAGCEPCLTLPGTVNNTFAFAERAPAAADIIAGVFSGQASSKLAVDAVDEETAAVQAVAARHGVPFLGFRGVSDGKGDPLGLPGFPVEFAVYRQLAANNSAAAVIGFLRSWRAAGLPTAQSR